MIAVSAATMMAAMWLRFEFSIPAAHWRLLGLTMPGLLAIRAATFVLLGLNRRDLRYTNTHDMVPAAMGVGLGTAAFWVMVKLVYADLYFSRSVIVIDGLLLTAAFAVLFGYGRIHRAAAVAAQGGRKKALIVGEGEGLVRILDEMQESGRWEPVGVLTETLARRTEKMRGITVLGAPGDLMGAVKASRPDIVCFVSPGVSRKLLLDLTVECRRNKIDFVLLRNRRCLRRPGEEARDDLNIELVLQREEVAIDLDSVGTMIRGKSVLVTGAGGSIGSELCRQIAQFAPRCLHLVERSENGLFFIHREISQKAPGTEVRPVLLDITDEQAVRREFLKASPDIVFHAAAHKHVGMMQHWPAEAVKNNVIGTLTVARAASAAGAERFVNISTDKAVRPKSFMGLSKRLAESCVAEMNLGSRTQFVTVRFGNVAGSVGSVVQLFRQQIDAGGPVTVTDKEARRYFMTIPEAVRLVLQAAVFSQSRGLFVLDMREPIEIQDLARTMISLAGYVPGEDIKIEFTRLGEAEKLTEELQDETERLVSTGHERVWRIAKTSADPGVSERALRWREMLAQGRTEAVLGEVREAWAMLESPAPAASVARAS